MSFAQGYGNYNDEGYSQATHYLFSSYSELSDFVYATYEDQYAKGLLSNLYGYRGELYRGDDTCLLYNPSISGINVLLRGFSEYTCEIVEMSENRMKFIVTPTENKEFSWEACAVMQDGEWRLEKMFPDCQAKNNPNVTYPQEETDPAETVESVLRKNNISIENYAVIDIDEVGKIIWEDGESSLFYFISDEGDFYSVDCMDGFFPSSNDFVDYKFCNYSTESGGIALHCRNLNTEQYYFLDNSFANILSITLNDHALKLKIKEDFECSDRLIEVIQNKILNINISSEIEFSHMDSSTESESFCTEIKDNQNYLNAVYGISDLAKQNSGSWYNDEALYAFVDMDNDTSSELILLKPMNSAAALDECHLFVIYPDGKYVDYGTNRALMGGINGAGSIIIHTDHDENMVAFRFESKYKTEQISAWIFCGKNGQKVMDYSKMIGDNNIRATVEAFDQEYRDVITELFDELTVFLAAT